MPSEIILIAAISADGYIARNSKDDISWSRDKALFKEQTFGFPIIMGPKTHNIIGKNLPGRENIIVFRHDSIKSVLDKIHNEKCFIIGGEKTFTRFSDYLTHLYLTVHPLIFGDGIPLFHNLDSEIILEKIDSIPIPNTNRIFQDQYKICR